MNGFNVSESGHVVEILPPQSIGGGVTTQPFSFKNAEHCSIIISFGKVGAAMPTSIQVIANTTSASGSASPPGGTALPFRYYLSTNAGAGGTSVDLLSPPVYATSAGLLQASMTLANNQYMVIEMDAAEITGNGLLSDSDGADYPYIVVSIVNGAYNTFCSAVAVMSGVRQAYQGGVSITA